jgi:hypothetical protein
VRRTATLTFAICLLAVGCGSEDEEASAPVACLQSAEAYLRALEAAPAAVMLDGTTPISDCLVPGQSAGDLANIGEAMVLAATELSAEARRAPASPAALRLGYLIGSVQRGAEETGGIHADLVRRLQTAARLGPQSGQPPKAIQRGFARGLAAGQATG